MGTRAIITVKGKPFIATHWDGYPAGLGKDLPKAKTLAQIIKVAAHKHEIDFADIESPAFKPYVEARFRAIAKKAKKPVQHVKDLYYKENKMITFGIMASSDYPISPIKQYGDFAEWQYDYDNGKWKGRELHGEWPKSKKTAGAWYPLGELVHFEQIERDKRQKQIAAEHAANQKAAKK